MDMLHDFTAAKRAATKAIGKLNGDAMADEVTATEVTPKSKLAIRNLQFRQ